MKKLGMFATRTEDQLSHLPSFLTVTIPPLTRNFFDLLPGNQFFAVADSLLVDAERTKGDGFSALKSCNNLWQFDARYHVAEVCLPTARR